MDAVDKIFDEDKAVKLLNFLLVGKRILKVSVSGFTPELHIKVASLKHNPSPFLCMATVRITIAGPVKIGEMADFDGLSLICCEDMPERRFIDLVEVTDKLIIIIMVLLSPQIASLQMILTGIAGPFKPWRMTGQTLCGQVSSFTLAMMIG